VHELSLAEAAWRQAESEMLRHPGRRLRTLRLVVGAWTGADPESLQFALGLLAADSRWPDAAVQVRPEPLAVACRACGRQFEPQDLDLACPACGGADVDVTRGMEVRLESLEIE